MNKNATKHRVHDNERDLFKQILVFEICPDLIKSFKKWQPINEANLNKPHNPDTYDETNHKIIILLF